MSQSKSYRLVCEECGEPFNEWEHTDDQMIFTCPNGHEGVETFFNGLLMDSEGIEKVEVDSSKRASGETE